MEEMLEQTLREYDALCKKRGKHYTTTRRLIEANYNGVQAQLDREDVELEEEEADLAEAVEYAGPPIEEDEGDAEESAIQSQLEYELDEGDLRRELLARAMAQREQCSEMGVFEEPVKQYQQELLIRDKKNELSKLLVPQFRFITRNNVTLLAIVSAKVLINHDAVDIGYEVNGLFPRVDHEDLALDARGMGYVRSLKGISPQTNVAKISAGSMDGSLHVGECLWVRLFVPHEGMRVRFFVHSANLGEDLPQMAKYYILRGATVVELSKEEWRQYEN